MRRGLKAVAYGIAGLLLCTSVIAAVSESAPVRFEGIPDRNAFGLKPPPKIEPNTPPPQIPKIILTGITTILGNKRALMLVHPSAGKPSEHVKDNSLILTEGQREGDIEVLQIDESAGSVKVNNSGTVMTLTFEKDGAKLPSTPAPAVMSNGLPPVASGIPVPRPNPYINSGAALTNAAGTRAMPTRRFRLPNTRGVAPGEATTATPNPSAVPAPLTAAPVPATAAPAPVPPVPQPAPAPQDLTPEEQAVLQQLQRETSPAANPPGQPLYPQ